MRTEAAAAELAFCEALAAAEKAEDASYAKPADDGAGPSNAPPGDQYDRDVFILANNFYWEFDLGAAGVGSPSPN